MAQPPSSTVAHDLAARHGRKGDNSEKRETLACYFCSPFVLLSGSWFLIVEILPVHPLFVSLSRCLISLLDVSVGNKPSFSGPYFYTEMFFLVEEPRNTSTLLYETNRETRAGDDDEQTAAHGKPPISKKKRENLLTCRIAVGLESLIPCILSPMSRYFVTGPGPVMVLSSLAWLYLYLLASVVSAVFLAFRSPFAAFWFCFLSPFFSLVQICIAEVLPPVRLPRFLSISFCEVWLASRVCVSCVSFYPRSSIYFSLASQCKAWT